MPTIIPRRRRPARGVYGALRKDDRGSWRELRTRGSDRVDKHHGRLRALFSLRSKAQLLGQARTNALDRQAELTTEHEELESKWRPRRDAPVVTFEPRIIGARPSLASHRF